MICDIMPALAEDGDGMGGEGGSAEDSNFEQLMVNMLDERDKLMETLRDTQDTLATAKTTLKETQLERDTLLHEFDLVLTKCDIDREEMLKKISAFDHENDPIIGKLKEQKACLAEEFVCIAKDLFQNKEKLEERNEEIAELKAERNNTKLLLEHLESLVSRHEKTLKLTVVKRQAQSSAGVSSEVEVLKALKSLFEHHKALDEKVRERLRLAVDKANSLEEDLAVANQEIERLQSENRLERERRNNSLDGNSSGTENVDDLYSEINDLKYRLEQKTRDYDKLARENKEVREKFNQLEEQVSVTTKKANYSYENNQKIMKELEEAIAQKIDIEERMVTLEKRYVRSQNDLSSASEEKEKLETELDGMRTMLEQKEEKIVNLQEQCKFYELKFSQTVKHVEELPKIQEELENRKAALNAAEERNFTAEEKAQNLQTQLEEMHALLSRATEREKLTEEHNSKLQGTVDKLMTESNEQLQHQLKERMKSLDDKNSISQQLDESKHSLNELTKEKGDLNNQVIRLKEELRLFNSANATPTTQSPPKATSPSSKHPTPFVRNTPPPSHPVVLATPLSTPRGAAEDEEWQDMNQAKVLSNVAIAFNKKDGGALNDTSDGGVPHLPESRLPAVISDDTLESLTSNDAQRLASMLQNQLDAINVELELLQVEHRTTERLTERIERRVGSETNSLDGSITSKDSSEKTHDNKFSKIEPYMRNRNSDEVSEGFGFTTYDPLDTKPLMLKRGRSQELLNETDTANSTSSESSSKSGRGQWSIASFDQDRGNHVERDYFEFSSSNPSSMTNSLESLSRRGGKNRSLKNSLGKIFSTKGKLKPRDLGFAAPTSDDLDSNNAEAVHDTETQMKRKLLEDIIASGAPFAAWNAPAILAWLELWVKLPEWYINACRANVKSGSIMSGLSDYEIQHEIGVNNPLHRLKLKLAIHEIVSATSPISSPTKTSLVFGDMNHFWIASEWLANLGLPQYRYPFIENLVDARMLEHISKKEYTKYLKVIDGFHRTSLALGTKCLEILNYDRKLLEKRRNDTENEKNDILVWSNGRIIKWVMSIGLNEFADCLRQSGIHGAVIALDDSFDANTLAYYLQIPPTNEKAREVLHREYGKLLTLCNEHQTRSSDAAESEFTRTKSWRKRFKKDKVKRKDDPGAVGGRRTLSESSSIEGGSPRRLTKSPILDRRHYSVGRGGVT